MRCGPPINRIRVSTATEIVLSGENANFVSISIADMAGNVLIIVRMRRRQSKSFVYFLAIVVVIANLSFPDLIAY